MSAQGMKDRKTADRRGLEGLSIKEAGLLPENVRRKCKLAEGWSVAGGVWQGMGGVRSWHQEGLRGRATSAAGCGMTTKGGVGR